MGLQINTNVAAINSYRNLTGTQSAMHTSLERLSSGLRINRAADDAAGLAISEKMRGQINGLNQAQSNAQDGISLIQTAEGAMNEVHSILQRMRTLAVQGANDTLSTTNRGQIKLELDQLNSEITSISNRTQFNGITLLPTTATTLTLQVGANKLDTMSVSLASVSTVDTTTFSTAGDANNLISTIDSAIDALSQTRATMGAAQNRLQHASANLGVSAENTAAAESRIRDTDMAKEMTAFSRSQILQNAGVSMLSQANQAPQSVLKLLG